MQEKKRFESWKRFEIWKRFESSCCWFATLWTYINKRYAHYLSKKPYFRWFCKLLDILYTS